MSEVKTRFAPSPTGYLHIGGVRTALFNWLFARHHGGKFVLRIEDTDLERSTRESVEAILDGMQWLGLDWDEGPYYQSERGEIYREYIDKLLEEGKAYRCYCSQETLKAKRDAAMKAGKKPKYDGTCRELKETPTGKNFTIRFRAPREGTTLVDDMIKGKVFFENSELDDLIIARSDGSPTYNFVVVIDDASMGISHIIRGDDHLNNTPRQILLYNALGHKPPRFGHVPLILGEDKKRLSKRHGATSVMAYKEMGYLPHALVNYLARLGWSHGDQEIFSIDELVSYFNTRQIGKSAGIFNAEKLLWLNAHYIRDRSIHDLADMTRPVLEASKINLAGGPELTRVMGLLQDRARTITELAHMARVYYADEVEMDEKAAAKFLTKESAAILNEVAREIEDMETFSLEEIESLFKTFIDKKGLKMKNVGPPVRVALTGVTSSPGIFEIIELLGQEKAAKRIKKAAASIA
ncbi:MAG: glutamate--tRNA ligase [Deltaproteobacteria bacterium]|nr:glutamate--tRNA ligase [Deltaproteobacteria bacterium]